MVEPLNTKAWVLVPVEPTPEMVEAGLIDKEDVTPSEIWAAMLSASPSLPVVDGGDLAERLAYRVGNPSAWPEGFDQKASDLFRSAASLISSQKQEIERLSGFVDGYGRLDAEFAAAESRVLSLEEEVKVLREALKPFGEYLDEVKFDLDNQGRLLPDDTEPGWTYLTAGDFRRARNALKVNGNG